MTADELIERSPERHLMRRSGTTTTDSIDVLWGAPSDEMIHAERAGAVVLVGDMTTTSNKPLSHTWRTVRNAPRGRARLG